MSAIQQKLCDVEINITDHDNKQKVGLDTSSFASKFEELSARLDQMQQLHTAATNHMQQTCQKIADQVSSMSGQFTPKTSDNVDRSMNIVLFGVDENKDAKIWRKKG